MPNSEFAPRPDPCASSIVTRMQFFNYPKLPTSPDTYPPSTDLLFCGAERLRLTYPIVKLRPARSTARSETAAPWCVTSRLLRRPSTNLNHAASFGALDGRRGPSYARRIEERRDAKWNARELRHLDESHAERGGADKCR